MQNPRRSRRPGRARRGYTMIEVLIVLTLLGVLMAATRPFLVRARDGWAVRAARQEVAATVDAARGAALQRGRSARVQVVGNALRAVVDTGAGFGSALEVLRSPDLRREYGIALSVATAADTLLQFDGRGLASPRLGRTARIRLTGRTLRDSVCVSNLGLLLPKACAL